jgi:hypothetical protein
MGNPLMFPFLKLNNGDHGVLVTINNTKSAKEKKLKQINKGLKRKNEAAIISTSFYNIWGRFWGRCWVS